MHSIIGSKAIYLASVQTLSHSAEMTCPFTRPAARTV